MVQSAPLSDELRNALGRQLQTGERLLWTGQPNPATLCRAALPVLFFGVPWTLFSLFWMGAAFTMTHKAGFGASAFGLFGLPFVAIGFFMLASPWWAWATARKTVYAVTTKRIITLSLSGRGTVKVESCVPAGGTADFERVEAQDGSGTLVYARSEGRDSDGDRVVRKKSFVGIPNVRGVEELIAQTFAAAAPSERQSVHTVVASASEPISTIGSTAVGQGWWQRRD